jgi:glyoxylase-like metal-dependent hydrolase (beta-lactamase superfamily II)
MKVIKILAIPVGIIAVIVIALLLYANTVIKNEIGKMYPNETKELIEGIYSIKDASSSVNMYLIKSGENYIAIDAGNKLQELKQGMDALEVSPEKVVAVLLTHSDSDHVGGLSLFKNAKVYISSAEEQMIDGQTVRALVIMKNSFHIPYEKLEDNQMIDISGVKIKCILTPGHTPGHMCYLINDKYLFSGDTLSLKDGKSRLFNDAFNMDSSVQAISDRDLAKLTDVQYIFTAHHGYTGNFMKAMAGWKKQ